MGIIERVAEWQRLERRPAPLDLSDKEILDWIDEYCTQAVYNRPTKEVRGGFTVYSDDIKVTEPTLREAVCAAAAILKEENL
jgi:hypothetical protein